MNDRIYYDYIEFEYLLNIDVICINDCMIDEFMYL